ncbi:nitrogenase|uniref:Nitrogenase molybdenum-iron protein alpha chain n=1 Tax=Dendrosporobacter quercicolus TaxID=146817 RepID=A0A1G9S597_9FIRM|nr:nitrogenase component 1 [Dendrosporobacter quercicolus]NSL49462.1 nitrogenase [Dendrosporobacter quercicolus DSM 1736]SDM30572.1 nitrogenase molybdenum-iron protein alpha chain [Dendrosporobacter quercicolus]
MNFFDQKEPPRREARLNACIACGGTLDKLANRKMSCCLPDGERSFTQNSICLLLPALGMMNSIPNSVVLMHGAIGCGSSSHGGNAGVRSGNTHRWGVVKDASWISTALSEPDVIGGGEEKLAGAIREIDERYNPQIIFVVGSCVPGIIGDDIDGVAQQLQPEIKAHILPVHCEGFKTKIWATAYDAVYHAIGRAFLQDPAEESQAGQSERPAVNLMNVSSMGRVDEIELERLLNALGFDVNVFPVFARPDQMTAITKARLSVSTCPTHDDYLLQYLEEKYGIPYVLRHMPIGIENTGLWLRDIAAHFGKAQQAEELIAAEEQELTAALTEFRSLFAGKKAFVSAGEFRALSTAILLAELGFEVVAVRSFHHDEFADSEYEKLIRVTAKEIPLNIANCQPFEEANLLRRIKPDIFLGHMNGNATAAKSGVATHVIYNVGLQYIGYKGVYELARRLYRQLQNPVFNRKLSEWTRLPYRSKWYEQDPFSYIRQAEVE